VPTIVFALWLTLLGRSAGHAILHVDLTVDRGTTSRRMADTAVTEAAAIWKRYGVDIRAASCPSSEYSIPLTVVFTGHHGPDTHEGSIGSIEFAQETPRPSLSLYVADVADLIEATVGAGTRAWPTVEHDAVEGRALGRALAHEIGHYLLRMRQHSRSGLMQAKQPALELIAPDRHRFSLSPPELARLDLLHASSVYRSAGFTDRVTADRISSQSNPSPMLCKVGSATTYE
jgi:hypothetical protein